ncbi:hypothetical protein HET69_12155 [Streptomyces sp. CJ_13]|uniref:DUF6233 domain-containing protein n=1 Tax=Streptomyces sp. CJ_13 TaxID=2724943 RepID=UPI001BDDB839|nr:DUF6233 domain-containing protein [Streptomyces sp. CJ_13]MBT1184765.1 hypothetical protein [Streptomyces sp. CJ_13]
MNDRLGPLPARILLVLPDEQTVEVRLYERFRSARGHPWRYRIGMPSWIATQDGVDAAEYSVWVTDHQLRPIDGADLSNVPNHRDPMTLPPPKPTGWVVRPAVDRRGTVVHDAPCPAASGGGREIGTIEALDALMRPGAKACHDCAAAEILIPALELGQGYG